MLTLINAPSVSAATGLTHSVLTASHACLPHCACTDVYERTQNPPAESSPYCSYDDQLLQ